MKVNVLGEEWTISRRTKPEDEYLKKVYGYCDCTSREIVYEPMPHDDVPKCETWSMPDVANKRIVRHELVHAFLYESGLAEDSDWALNEAMVDWIARQFPKLLKAFQEVGAL